MKIYYLTDTPTEIACVGGDFTSSWGFSSFQTSIRMPVSHNTHEIVWSGDVPGEGKPNLIERSAEEILATETRRKKRQATADKLDQIDVESAKRVQDGQLFQHDGRNYYIDRDSFYIIFMGLSQAPDGYTRKWKTADKGDDGINNIYVDLDVAGIRGMLWACVVHCISVWDKADAKKKEVKVLCLDDTKTVSDIENYDHTTGW